MNFKHRATILSFVGAAMAAVCALTGGSAEVRAQGLLYGFETGLEGWEATGYGDSDFISIAQSTSGATQGTQSMVVETGPTYGWDVRASVSAGNPIYDLYNIVAADPASYTLDFDVSMTPDSFASVSAPGAYFLLSVAANSDLGWQQALNVTPNLTNQLGTFPVSIPMSQLPLGQDSGFYQLNIGSNSDHANGAGGQGVKYFIDNLRFTRLPELTATTLFSWETPDVPGTPENEQFEGWGEGFSSAHVHSITSVGATDGASALQIDRTSQASGFTWGSDIEIAGGSENPAGQAIIDSLVSSINGARAIAFDVRFDDSFPNTPTWTRFGLHVTDHRGGEVYPFFQAEGASINGVQPLGAMHTVEIPLTSMTDVSAGLGTLAAAGLTPGTDSLRIGLSVNTDGGGIYQIDNFRVIREVAPLAADFNDDGTVDGLDLAAWKTAFGVGAGADADGDGDSDGNDFLVWQREYAAGASAGSASVAAVPEPAALLLLGPALLLGFHRRG